MIEAIEKHFFTKANEVGSKYLTKHVPQVEKWAKYISQHFPETDQPVLLMSVWLHDIGRLTGDETTDHAVRSEIETRRYLNELGAGPDLIDKVAHCVRAHRCKDVQPETIEAKILAVADSASHLTDGVYINVALRGEVDEAKDKLERDYLDIGLLPEIQVEIRPMYEAWKKLLEVYMTV